MTKIKTAVITSDEHPGLAVAVQYDSNCYDLVDALEFGMMFIQSEVGVGFDPEPPTANSPPVRLQEPVDPHAPLGEDRGYMRVQDIGAAIDSLLDGTPLDMRKVLCPRFVGTHVIPRMLLHQLIMAMKDNNRLKFIKLIRDEAVPEIEDDIPLPRNHILSMAGLSDLFTTNRDKIDKYIASKHAMHFGGTCCDDEEDE